MTPEQLKCFDEASNHPYECKCELCKEWWALMLPEDDVSPAPLCIDYPHCPCGEAKMDICNWPAD